MEEGYRLKIEKGISNSKEPKKCKEEDFHKIEENIEENLDRKEG